MLFKAGLTALVLAATVQAEDKVARLHQTPDFYSPKMDIKLDNSCVSLGRDFFHSVGAISIPCPSELPEGKKAICTLFQTQDCKEADAIYSSVTYERSHFDMYKRTPESPYAVGYLAGSVKCEIVDAGKEIEKGYNHISTTSESACVGKPCGSDDDCLRNSFGALYCEKRHGVGSNKCQRSEDRKCLIAEAVCSSNFECCSQFCLSSSRSFPRGTGICIEYY